MELCMGGELYHYLVASRGFPEPLIRSLLEQLLNAIEYMHAQEITHRDLKPENLLLGEDCNIKLADFGFAAKMNAENGIVSGRVGSDQYAAPEVWENQPYSGTCADIYSLGIILFNLRMYLRPFGVSLRTDSLYAQYRKDVSLFWQGRAAKSSQPPPSEEFQHIVNWMLAENPSGRPTIRDIRSHAWMAGEKLSPRELQDDMRRRYEHVRRMINQKKEENKKKRHELVLPSERFRDFEGSGSSIADLSGSQGRNLPEFKSTVFSYFRIFTHLTADQSAFLLRGKFLVENISVQESNERFRFELGFSDEGKEVGKAQIDLLSDEGCCVIDCKRLSGCFFSFSTFFDSVAHLFDSSEPHPSFA